MSDIDEILGAPGNTAVSDYWWPAEYRTPHSLNELPGPASLQRDAQRDTYWEGTPQATPVETFRSYARPAANAIEGILDESGVGLASQFLIPGAKGGRGVTWKTEVPREGAPTASLDVGGVEFSPRLPPTGDNGPHVLGGLLAKRPTAPANANSAEVVSIGPREMLDALDARIADVTQRANHILTTTGSNAEWLALKERQSHLESQRDAILLDRVERGLGDPQSLVGPAVKRASTSIVDALNTDHGLTLMRGGPPLDTAEMLGYLKRLQEAASTVKPISPIEAAGGRRPEFGVYPDRPAGRFDDGYGGSSGVGIPFGADRGAMEGILRDIYGVRAPHGVPAPGGDAGNVARLSGTDSPAVVRGDSHKLREAMDLVKGYMEKLPPDQPLDPIWNDIMDGIERTAQRVHPASRNIPGPSSSGDVLPFRRSDPPERAYGGPVDELLGGSYFPWGAE